MNYNQIPIVNPFAENLRIVRDFFKKPIVLAFAIVAALTVISSIFMSIYIASSEIIASFGELILAALKVSYNEGSIDAQTYRAAVEFAESLGQPGNIVSTLISSMTSSIPAILAVCAAFLIYFKSKSPAVAASPSVGFSIYYVLAIIGLIGAALMAFLFLILAIIFIFAAAAVADPESAIVSIILAVVLLVSAALSLFYKITEVMFFSNVKKSVESMELSRKGAKSFGIVNIILCAIGFLSAVYMVYLGFFYLDLNTILYYTLSPFELAVYNFCQVLAPFLLVSAAVSLIGVAYQLLLGIIALGYNKHIKNIEDNFTPVVMGEQNQIGGFSDSIFTPQIQPVSPVASGEYPLTPPPVSSDVETVQQALPTDSEETDTHSWQTPDSE